MAIAGNTAAGNIDTFSYIAFNSFQTTCIAFVSQNATPGDEMAQIIDGIVYVGAGYNSLKDAAAAEKFILVQGGTYKTEGQSVLLAGATISGSDKATVSDNVYTYADINYDGGAAFRNNTGKAWNVSGMTFTNNKFEGATAKQVGGGAIFSNLSMLLLSAIQILLSS